MQFQGSPDLIVEVVSPDSQSRDRVTKFREYEAAGVLEYWLPDPTLRTFEAYGLDAGDRYVRLPTTAAGRTYSTVLTGVFFDDAWLRQLHPPEDPLPLIYDMSTERARLLSSPPPPPSDNDR